jgi:hypothetical protein
MSRANLFRTPESELKDVELSGEAPRARHISVDNNPSTEDILASQYPSDVMAQKMHVVNDVSPLTPLMPSIPLTRSLAGHRPDRMDALPHKAFFPQRVWVGTSLPELRSSSF